MKKGYLIPENAQPTDTRCLRVFVPDDPLYMAALLGALTFFGQWTAWERDTEKRGQFAAAAWKDANDLTIDGLSLPCGDYPLTEDEMSEILQQLEDIQSQLAEINDMNITVTQTACGCGCSDGTATTTTTTDDGIIIDPEDDGKIPKYDILAKPTSDSGRCRAANWLAVTVADMTRTMATIGSVNLSLQNVYSILIGLFTIRHGVIWNMTAVFALAYRLINLVLTDTYGYFDTVADKMERDMEPFVCALYNWSSAENLGASLNGVILGFVNETKAELGLSDEIADSMYAALADVMGAAFVNYVVNNIDTIVPSDFVAQYSCICGATGADCPDIINLVTRGIGSLPDGDLTGTTQGLAAQFNTTTGFYELIFELATNYCVTIQNSGDLSIEEMHQVCVDGVMSPSDGSCIRRYAARSQAPFATAVTFVEQTVDCACAGAATDIWTVVPQSSPFCVENMQLTESGDGDTSGQVDYSGTIAKGSQYGAYKFVAKLIEPTLFNDRIVQFYNLSQDQNKDMVIEIVTELGSTSETTYHTVPIGVNHEIDLSGRVVLHVGMRVTVGIYNLPCPTDCGGSMIWVLVPQA